MRIWILVLIILNISFSSCNRTKEVSKGGSIDTLKAQAMSCYFFFIPDCPACKASFQKVSELSKEYAVKGLTVTAVYSDPFPDTLYLKKTLEDYDFDLPVIYDTDLMMARNFSVKATPQFILTDSAKNVVYSGAFDNYYYSLGKHRNVVTEKYLENAIIAVLNNRRPDIKETEPIGCKINYNLTEK